MKKTCILHLPYILCTFEKIVSFGLKLKNHEITIRTFHRFLQTKVTYRHRMITISSVGSLVFFKFHFEFAGLDEDLLSVVRCYTKNELVTSFFVFKKLLKPSNQRPIGKK